MATVVSGPADSGNTYIDALVAGGNHWSGTITYSFHNTGAKAWSQVEKDAFRSALDAWSSVANISFQELADDDGTANLREFLSFDTESVKGSHESPFNETDGTLDGYFNYNGVGWDYETGDGGLRPGGFGFLTILQEVGRALGLTDPHNHNGNSEVFPGVTPGDAGDSGDFNLNSDVYTVMSDVHGLHSKPVNGNFGQDNQGYPTGPMAFDIAAIQRLYGSATRNSGNDTYFLGGSSSYSWTCIWDTGGTDTIALPGISDGGVIDLRAASLLSAAGGGGFISQHASGGGANFTIAAGVLIENALGGAGEDTLIGNSANNELNGRDQNDRLYGADGSDTLIGGGGNDTLVYMNPAEGADLVTGFESGGDRFEIDQSGFGLAGTGTLAAAGASFETGTDATGGGPTFLWHKASGQLAFDSNGSAAGGKTLLANVVTDPASTAVDASWGVAVTGDLNGDGDSDIVWRNANGETRIWEMSNNAKAEGYDVPLVDSSWQIAGSGDFDNDGTDDILWQNAATGELLFWRMQNHQKTDGFPLGVIDTSWAVEATGDFNGDGTDDVLFRNRNTDEALVWTINAGAKTEGFGLGMIDDGWGVSGAGDFDNDGTADLAFRNAATGELLLWKMQGGQKQDGYLVGAADNVWNVVSTGDTNNDGTSDIVWRNSQSGELLSWTIDNLAKNGGLPSGLVDLSWNVAEDGDFNGNGVGGLLWRDASGSIVVVDHDGWNQANLASSDFIVV